MASESTGVDYSLIHKLDSPANRLLREFVWDQGDDLGQQSFATPRYFDRLIDVAGLDTGMHVLDLGSGTGGPSVYIATRSGCAITGVEVNEVGIRYAGQLAAASGLGDRVTFVQADGMRLPFADATFDAAISLNVLNVFADKVALFREVRRVLRPGGRLAFLSGTFEFGPGDEETRDLLERGYAVQQYFDSIESYKQKLREAGFVVDEIIEYISDFRAKVARWRQGWIENRDAIAAEQGAEQTDHHIEYFGRYLAMIDAGRASNQLVVATRAD